MIFPLLDVVVDPIEMFGGKTTIIVFVTIIALSIAISLTSLFIRKHRENKYEKELKEKEKNKE